MRTRTYIHQGFAQLAPQNYQASNRGDMFTPFGSQVDPTFLDAATSASPFMGSPMPVHSVPVSYQGAGWISRVMQRVGLQTPKIQGVQ